MPGHRAAGDVPHTVAARALAGEAGAAEGGEDVGQVLEFDPVELNVLTGRQLTVVPAEAQRELADGAKLAWARGCRSGLLTRIMKVPILGLSW